MMQVLRLDSTEEMELSGTRSELLALARSLRNDRGRHDLHGDPAPFPYSRSLSEIEVREISGGAVNISWDGSSLKIRGGRSALDLLADNIGSFASEAADSDHLHIEYFPGHFYLSPESESLVLAISG